MNIQRRSDPTDDRGASAIEYALVVSLLVVVTLAAITTLSSSAQDVLIDSGNDVGTPRAPRTELLGTP